jgi:hypothetical protein
MNERIKQLALEAGLVRNGDFGMKRWEGPRSDSINDQDLEKFAELIVRECALVAKTLPHTPERHWVQDSVTYIPVHCEQNILKHFGVEE